MQEGIDGVRSTICLVGLMDFPWNGSTKCFEVENEVWDDLIKVFYQTLLIIDMLE